MTPFFLLFKGFIPRMVSFKQTCFGFVCNREKEAIEKFESIAVHACDNIPMIHSDVEVLVDAILMGEEFSLLTLKSHAIVQASKFTMNELKATANFHRLSSIAQKELKKEK